MDNSVKVIPGHKKNTVLRVAAYCRVSCEADEQTMSFETQIHYYRNLIDETSEWEFAGIYAERFAGAGFENRTLLFILIYVFLLFVASRHFVATLVVDYCVSLQVLLAILMWKYGTNLFYRGIYFKWVNWLILTTMLRLAFPHLLFYVWWPCFCCLLGVLCSTSSAFEGKT